MPRRKKELEWFPLYVRKWLFGSIRDDLTPAERGAWVDLLSIAYMDNDEGRISGGINRVRRISNTPWRILRSCVQKSLDSKEGEKPRLKQEGQDLLVLSWSKYALTDRQRKYWSYEKGTSRKTPQLADNGRKKPTMADYRREEKRIDKNIVEEKKARARAREKTNYSPPIHSLEKDLEDQPLIAKLWEQLTSKPVPPLLWQEFRPYEDTDPEILDYAFREAARRNIDKWPYIKKIIDRRSGKEGAVQDSYSPRDPEAEAKLAAKCLKDLGGKCDLKAADKVRHRYCDYCPKWSD